MPQASIENARIVLLFIILFWIFNSDNSGPALISTPLLAGSRLVRQRQALGVLNATKWGDFSPHEHDGYLNLTGFRETDGYAWEDLDRFRGRCREWSRNAYSVVLPGEGNGEGEWEKKPDQHTWLNATGTVSGEWVRQPGTNERHVGNYNLSGIGPGLGWPGPHAEWDRNITGRHGTVTLQIDEVADKIEYEERDKGDNARSSDLARQVSAMVTFEDVDSGSSNWEMRVFGVHWPRQGAILLSTTSEKFAGIFGLPHLAPSQGFFHSSQQLLNNTVHEVLRRKERARFSDPSNQWTSEVSGIEDPWSLTPHCEYVMYLQLYALDSPLVRNQKGLFSNVQDLEGELRHPTGAPIGDVPDLRMSLVAWSPDCSYFLESKGPPHFASVDGKHLVGMKEEMFIHRASRWVLSFGAVLVGQLWLLKTQMRETSTPSTTGRVSFYTASIMLLADGLVFAGASAWSLSAVSTFLPCLLVTFASFMLMILGGAFLSDVYKIQEPERRNRERNYNNAPRATPSPAPAGDSLPRPVTAGPPRPPSPPIIIPSDQDIDAEIAQIAAEGAAAVPSALPRTTTTTGATTTTTTTTTRPPRATASFSSITGHFVLIGIFILFLTAAASSWPTPIRSFYKNTVALLYFSMWVPQIWRNVQRNSRRAFSWRFMIGQSVLRLIPFAYFYLCERNFLFAKPDPRTFAFICGWVWVQLWVLGFQDILGPRFGMPKGLDWLPEAWDYHPLLREDDLESGGLPIGLVGSAGGGDGSPVLERVRSWSVGGAKGGNIGASSGEGARERERDKERERNGMSVRCIDCAICREVLEVPLVRAGAEDAAAGGGVAGVLARRAYMVTPCRHIFHTKCLEGWLRFRLQCPICREGLPPL